MVHKETTVYLRYVDFAYNLCTGGAIQIAQRIQTLAVVMLLLTAVIIKVRTYSQRRDVHHTELEVDLIPTVEIKIHRRAGHNHTVRIEVIVHASIVAHHRSVTGRKDIVEDASVEKHLLVGRRAIVDIDRPHAARLHQQVESIDHLGPRCQMLFVHSLAVIHLG